jgi:hypothetical protein
MKRIQILAIVLTFLTTINSNAWHDRTHIAVGLLARYDMAYNLAGPDVTKIKAGNVEGYNHYSNNSGADNITGEIVKDQIGRYNMTEKEDESGHLYGAIIGAIRAYQEDKRGGKYAEYHLAFLGHYLGDLCNPLHNTAYDDFNKKRHKDNDAIVEQDITAYLQYIPIFEIEINSEEDVINMMIQVANNSIKLGKKIRDENRNMTKDEAYHQISQSASLFKGILKWLKK